MRIVVFDETGGRDTASEDIHLDRELDLAAPDIIELDQPLPLIGAGEQTLRGFVHDQSAVPLVTLDVGGTQVACPDATPTDSLWACTVDLGSRADGTVVPLRLKARDIHGQESGWVEGPTLVVDTTAPALTLGDSATAALADRILGPDEAALGGELTDNRYAERVEVCDLAAGRADCQPAEVTLAATTGPTLTYQLDDVPETPLTVGSATACATGTPLVRTFTVPDPFTVADVDLGLTVAHPFRNDLVATLTSPTGTVVEVVARGAAVANLDVWLTDATPLSLFLEEDQEAHDLMAPAFHNVRRTPSAPLAAFRGEAAQGVWQLSLCDDYAAEDDGQYLRARLALRSTSAPTGTGAQWAYTLPLPPHTEQAQTLAVYGYDAAGNRSAPLSLAFTLDTRAPVLTPTLTLPTSSDGAAFHFAGRATDAHTLTLGLDILTPDRQLLRPALPFDQTGWSTQSTEPFTQLGTYCLWVHAVDAPGNTSRLGPFALRVSAGQQVLYLPLLAQAGAAASEPAMKSLAVRASTTVYLPLVRSSGAAGAAQPYRLTFVDASACR